MSHVEVEVTADVYKELHKLSLSINKTANDVVATICAHVFNSRELLSEIGLYFKRNLIVNKTVYMGCNILDFELLQQKTLPVRINIPNHVRESLDAIAHALDAEVEEAIVLILEICFGIRDKFYLTENPFTNRNMLN